MPSVLIPSDNRDFVRYLAREYHRSGWEVAVGTGNFELETARYDLVHLQWPEELTGWAPPSEKRLASLVERLDSWCARSRVVMTVHNIEPHRDRQNPMYRRLYEAVHERVPIQHHFTEASREALLAAYPTAAKARHVVTGYFNLDMLLPAELDREAARKKGRFAPKDFVIMVFGGLREWDEVALIRDAYDAVQVRGRRLLMCGRYQEGGPRFQQMWRRWQWQQWLRSRSAAMVDRHVPDDEVHTFVEAADVVLIPRFRSMNSGLPALGATFGKPIVAPRCGSYPELLEGTRNLIYEPGDPKSCARALEAAALLPREEIHAENRKLAASWQWSRLLGTPGESGK